MIGVSGKFNWAVLGEDGEAVQRGEQKNLILDGALDYLMVSNPAYLNACVAVGVGDSQPVTTQVALDAEVARTGTMEPNRGDTNFALFVAPGEYRVRRTWLFDAGAINANLTEVGWSNSGTPRSGVLIRQLFRDLGGNPVVVSVSTGQQLRIEHELTVRLDTAVRPASWTVDGLGTLTGRAGLFGTQDGLYTSTDLRSSGVSGNALYSGDTAGSLHLLNLREQPAQNTSLALNAERTEGFLMSAAGYVAGTFRRRRAVEIGPSYGNLAFNAIGLGHYYGSALWVLYASDLTARLRKSDTQKLRLEVEVNATRLE